MTTDVIGRADGKGCVPVRRHAAIAARDCSRLVQSAEQDRLGRRHTRMLGLALLARNGAGVSARGRVDAAAPCSSATGFAARCM